MIVLPVLQRRGSEFVPIREPLARTLEEVPSSGALWVRAVEYYRQMAKLPEAQRREAMKRRLAELSADAIDSDSFFLAQELEATIREQR